MSETRTGEAGASETGAGEAPTAEVSRRRFLKVTLPAVGAAVLAACGFAAFEDWFGFGSYLAWQMRGPRDYAAATQYLFLPAEERIKRHFSDLTIDDAGLRRFVRDYEKHVGRIKWYSVTSNRVLFSKFLLSSDYYRNGADPKLPVKYVMFYDPYVSPCWNPFARMTVTL
jgi:hypothetical protein